MAGVSIEERVSAVRAAHTALHASSTCSSCNAYPIWGNLYRCASCITQLCGACHDRGYHAWHARELVLTNDSVEHVAAAAGDLALLQRLASEQNVSALAVSRNRNGETPMHLAAAHDHPHALAWLLTAVPQESVELLTTTANRTVAHHAAQAGSWACLEVLAECGCQIYQQSIMAAAAATGRLDVCKRLYAGIMRQDTLSPTSSPASDPVSSQDAGLSDDASEETIGPELQSVLAAAARRGQLAVVSWLVMDVGVPVFDGTALMWAALSGQVDVVEFLADRTPATTKSIRLASPIAAAATSGSVPALELLYQRGYRCQLVSFGRHPPLHHAVARGQVAAAQWIVAHGGLEVYQRDDHQDQGADPGRCFPRLSSLFVAAIVNGNPDILQWLVTVVAPLQVDGIVLTVAHHPIVNGPSLSVPQLRKLRLANTRITSLPDGIARLSLLEALDVSMNPLSVLPADLWRLTRLDQLDLSGTQVAAIPASLLLAHRLTSPDAGLAHYQLPTAQDRDLFARDALVSMRTAGWRDLADVSNSPDALVLLPDDSNPCETLVHLARAAVRDSGQKVDPDEVPREVYQIITDPSPLECDACRGDLISPCVRLRVRIPHRARYQGAAFQATVPDRQAFAELVLHRACFLARRHLRVLDRVQSDLFLETVPAITPEPT